ncbi:MAG: VWA domain-containing protein [Beijerinckiaceae bacterium]|nr:VWA domain-containing protein [Beijerinckiaceae bacterium]
MLRRFTTNESGNIATIFGLSTFALLGAASAGLDYSRMTNTRAALSSAADAAALAAAQAPPNEAVALARQVFDANFTQSGLVAAFSAAPFKKGADSAFRVEVTANVPMTLSKVMGVDTRPVRSVSDAILGNDQDIQIALVLDVTASMLGSKLTSLKTAASGMVNTLYDKLTQGNQIKMAVVPFAQYVNVGIANRNQPWLSVPPDSSTTQQACWQTRDITRTYNCRMQFHSWTDWNDGVATPRSGTWEVCDHDYGPYYQTCQNQTTTLTWKGCVGSRNHPLNVRDQNYITNPVPGVMNVSCPPALTTLSSSRSTVLNAINGLAAVGNTYIPSGLMWGWATLSPIEPFSEPTNANRKTQRYVVLMTDGENTMSPTYPKHDGYDTATANALTAELCTNIKADGVQVFTIAFDVTSNSIKNLLRACATSADKYFDATNAMQLSSAFNAIAQQMTMLRIAR